MQTDKNVVKKNYPSWKNTRIIRVSLDVYNAIFKEARDHETVAEVLARLLKNKVLKHK